jgi:hypothetical protein
MVKKYTISCKLCKRIHYPVFGKLGTGAVGIVPPKKILFPYTCPITHKRGQTEYPYDKEIYGRGITGWRDEDD